MEWWSAAVFRLDMNIQGGEHFVWSTCSIHTLVMKRTRVIACLMLCMVWFRSVATAAEPNQDTAKLEQLVEAVQTLKGKTIPEAYFWLGSPQVPPSTIFAPDTKGRGFVIIARNSRQNETLRVFYNDGDWAHLVSSVKSWTVPKADVTGVFAPNQWQMADDDILALRIPDRTEEFFAALLKGWRTNKDDFRCGIHWN